MSGKRISEHPVLEFHRKESFYFDFEGEPVLAYTGETIASALYAKGVRRFTESKLLKRPRGFFCAIGKCSSCIMEVNGIPHVRTCVTLAEEGMKIRSHPALPKFPDKIPVCPEAKREDIQVAVVGGGPAGLSAAATASKLGAEVHLFDDSGEPGGQLVKQTHQFFGDHDEHAGTRGVDIGKLLVKDAKRSGVNIHTRAIVLGYYPEMTITVDSGALEIYDCQGMVYAAGAVERFLAFENNDLPGIYGAGGVQTLMNEYGIVPGDKVLMVGAGNVGLIVSYQLIQAGVEVVEVIDAMPRVGGYQVHASKLRRAGVPIRTSHTIRKAIGEEHVTGAVVQELNGSGRPKKGTERELVCDIICMAVGLKPDTHLLRLAGCEMKHVPELGGTVPLRTEDLETTVRKLFVAGDSSGIEEATVAILEGQLAGAALVERLLGVSEDTTKIKKNAAKSIASMRSGPYGIRPREGVRECTLQGRCEA